MRIVLFVTLLGTLAVTACNRTTGASANAAAAEVATPKADSPIGSINGEYVGFDRNDYPGDDAMNALHNANRTFAFTGYWLTNPPESTSNSWLGKRDILRKQGWGFLVLVNGKLDAEILKAQKHGTSPTALGQQDASAAVAAAKTEHFPAGTILFLDQEEGGRLLDEQAAYLLGWTEAVAASDFRAGVYASGQPVSDGPGVTIDTIRDIRDRVKKGHLHEIAMFDAQDECPPAPGCTVNAKPLSTSGEPDLIAWQFAQSPRRPELTLSCAATYAADGNCYAPKAPGIFLDMDVAKTSDPSYGR